MPLNALESSIHLQLLCTFEVTNVLRLQCNQEYIHVQIVLSIVCTVGIYNQCTNTPFTLQRLDRSHQSGTLAKHSVNGTIPYRTVLERNKSCHSRMALTDNVNAYRSDACALAITLNNLCIIIVWPPQYAEV